MNCRWNHCNGNHKTSAYALSLNHTELHSNSFLVDTRRYVHSLIYNLKRNPASLMPNIKIQTKDFDAQADQMFICELQHILLLHIITSFLEIMRLRRNLFFIPSLHFASCQAAARSAHLHLQIVFWIIFIPSTASF